MTNKHFDFPFYECESKLKNEPFLRQPIGDNWKEYTWAEAGLAARKLATGRSEEHTSELQSHS